MWQHNYIHTSRRAPVNGQASYLPVTQLDRLAQRVSEVELLRDWNVFFFAHPVPLGDDILPETNMPECDIILPETNMPECDDILPATNTLQ